METIFNVTDPKVIENTLRLSEINKDLDYIELMNIIDNKQRYSVVYTTHNEVLHINDNSAVIYHDINISVKEKKIYILFKDNKERECVITFNLYYDYIDIVTDIFTQKYSMKHVVS